MPNLVADLWAGFSLAKLAYSVVLIAVIWLLASELLRVWLDRQLYVSAPNYFDDGKADSVKAAAFGSQILAHHHRLRAELNSELERRRAEAVTGPAEVLRRWPVVKDTLSLPPEGLKQLELKIQGFDIGGLLTKLRGWISPDNEAVVTVEARAVPPTARLVEAGVSWAQAPQWDKQKVPALRYFITPPAASDDVAAAAVAASLLWADVAKGDEEFRKIPHEEFSAWARGWQRYRIVRDRGATAGKLEKIDTDLLEEAGKGIKPILDRKPAYPEVWRLAANLVALHPTSIPDNKLTWEKYRDLYLAAIGAPATQAGVLPPADERSAGILGPGGAVWTEDGQLGAKITAVLKDAGGKRFLLLPGLLARDDQLPKDLFDRSAPPDRRLVARVVRLIEVRASGPKIALAEMAAEFRADNGAIKELGEEPKRGDALLVSETAQVGTVGGIDVPLSGLGEGFLEVSPRVTAAGDAGIAILNRDQKLVAMAYAGTESKSFLLPLPGVLKRENLSLAN